jgi:hypothetical protein
MANFPSSLDNGTSLPTPGTSDHTNSPSHAGLHSAENAAIIATETKLGTGASTPVVSTLLFGTGTGTSAWTQLTSAQLLASLTDETGTGSAVFATTPTLVTPKVDTINEATGGNGTTVGGVNLKSGIVTGSGAGLTSATVPGAALVNASVTPSKLATGAAQAFVTTVENTTSTSYADLTTTTDTVTVTIGANGLALVSIHCGEITNGTSTTRTRVSFAVSGATTQAATDTYSLQVVTSNASLPQIGASGVFLLTGLTAGSTTFKMKYKVDSGTGSFTNRRIAVVPL